MSDRSGGRVSAVAALSFASGLPLGLVWIALPDALHSSGTPLRWVGLLTLTQLPWTLKFLWSPLMDRFVPGSFGRRRGWVLLCQIGLAAGMGGLAWAFAPPILLPAVFALSLGIAFASASQDIAIDAYAVDVLTRKEYGLAVGLRTATYRAAMLVAGGLSIWAAGRFGWPGVLTALAALWLPLAFVTVASPREPSDLPSPATMREAVWSPLIECFRRPRALELLAFVVLYKLSDNLSQSLLRPFLDDMGYSAQDRGLWLGLLGLIPTLLGTFAGGLATGRLGLGRALWIFGFLQIFSNVGYLAITAFPGSRPWMIGAMTFELATTGLGMGAFGVFLLRLTRKRFSATQYALFSSLFGLPRAFSGPVTGFAVDAFGWPAFFVGTMVAGLPGLWMLHRFSPWGVRDPDLDATAADAETSVPRLPAGALMRAAFGAIAALAVGTALHAMRTLANDSAATFLSAARQGWTFGDAQDFGRLAIWCGAALAGAAVGAVAPWIVRKS